jgi:hypothetical protein
LAPHELSIEACVARPTKVIIASLVNIEERSKHLRSMGMDDKRIVLLS